MQVYANADNDPPHAFHRVLFVFVCRDPNCSKVGEGIPYQHVVQTNDASNFIAFRCQMPRENPFYSADKPVDADYGEWRRGMNK